MAIEQQHHVFSNRLGWFRSSQRDDAEIRREARDLLIVRDFDRGMDPALIGQQHRMGQSTVLRIVRQYGRNLRPPSPASATLPAIGIPRRINSPQQAGSEALLRAILRLFVRTDTLPSTMTVAEMRQRCAAQGIECP